MKHLLSKRLAPLQAQLHGQWRDSRARQLWQAWLNELRALLPAAVRARVFKQADERLIDWPLTGPCKQRNDERLILLLPADQLLTQTLLLPTAALRDVHTVLASNSTNTRPTPAISCSTLHG